MADNKAPANCKNCKYCRGPVNPETARKCRCGHYYHNSCANRYICGEPGLLKCCVIARRTGDRREPMPRVPLDQNPVAEAPALAAAKVVEDDPPPPYEDALNVNIEALADVAQPGPSDINHPQEEAVSPDEMARNTSNPFLSSQSNHEPSNADIMNHIDDLSVQITDSLRMIRDQLSILQIGNETHNTEIAELKANQTVHGDCIKMLSELVYSIYE